MKVTLGKREQLTCAEFTSTLLEECAFLPLGADVAHTTGFTEWAWFVWRGNNDEEEYCTPRKSENILLFK